MVGVESDDELKGIIPRAFLHIFGAIDAEGHSKKYLVRCSYLEIYNEKILDLLSNNQNMNLDIKEDPNQGIYVKDLKTVICKSVTEINN